MVALGPVYRPVGSLRRFSLPFPRTTSGIDGQQRGREPFRDSIRHQVRFHVYGGCQSQTSAGLKDNNTSYISNATSMSNSTNTTPPIKPPLYVQPEPSRPTAKAQELL